MDKISFDFIDIEIPDFNPEFFGLWLEDVVKLYQKELNYISFVFCSDDYLLNINKEYLNHDYYTDIITFNYNEGNSLSGDIFISVDRVSENANEYSGGSFMNELCRVVVHGVLHLVGFNDKTIDEEMVMRNEEDRCLMRRNSFT